MNHALLGGAAAATLLAAAVAGQQSTFRASVDLVSVDVQATAKGELVLGLGASDFEVRDNGVLQRIESISGEGTAATVEPRQFPLDVVLVLDMSESVAGQKFTRLVDGAKAVLERLRPADRAALVTFSERTVVRHGLSSNISSIARALDLLSAGGRTSMFDALFVGLSLRRTTDTRQMVLLFSDGRDNSSWLDGQQLARMARQSDVVVYAVGLDNRVKDDMKEIAEETGGATIVAQSPRELRSLFSKLVREMQARYILTYYATGVPASGWHSIEVRLVRRRAELVARRGYWRK
jgi:VWFA-related protein